MEIKENIQWLCKLLYSNGFTPLTPETFRQGKFNQDNAISPFWKFLYELVTYLHDGQVNLCEELENDMIIILKKKVYMLGYKSSVFLELDHESKLCSRELLLSIGWIISTYNIIDTMASSCIISSLVNCEDSSCINKKKEKKKSLSVPETNTDIASNLLWYLGHLKFSLSSLLTVQQQRITYLHEIHKKTEGKGLSHNSTHLSMLESVIVNNKDLQKKYIEQLEKETKFLTAYLHWKEGESVFWKWMESVIELKQKECAITPENNNDGDEDYFLPTNEFIQRNVSEMCPSSITVPMHEPRLIYQNKTPSKNKKMIDQTNKDLCSLRHQLKETVEAKQKQYQTMFEELTENLHGVTYIPP